MRRFGRGAAVLAIATAAVGASGGSALAASARIGYRLQFTTPQRDRPTGATLRIRIQDPGAPAGQAPYDPHAKKPPPVSHVHYQLAPGVRFDTTAIPQCTATDAELMLAGPSACPAGSRVGHDDLVIDEDTSQTSDRYVKEDITLVNERNGLILVSHDPTGAYVVVHAKVGLDTIDIDVPPFPGTPPDGGAIKTEDAIFYALSGRRGGRTVGYLTTPKTCPASGKWTVHTTWTFRSDGTKQTAADSSPCFRGPASLAPLRVVFFHRQAARAGKKVHVRVMATRASKGTARIAGHGRTLVRKKVKLHAGVNTLRLHGVPAGRYRFRLSARVPGRKPISRSARLTVR